jgi:hypothetical protein
MPSYSMQKDDLVFVGHMLDTARKALVLVRGNRARTSTGMWYSTLP